MCKYCQDPEIDIQYFDDIECEIKLRIDEPIEGTNGKKIEMGLSLPVTIGGCVWSPDKTISLFVADNFEEPILKDIDFRFPINFCPMCGRKLNGTAD